MTTKYHERVTDSYEGICDRCRDLSDQIDLRRWEIGDYALLIEMKYGEHTADDFARDIGCNSSTVRNWKRVAKFYTQPFRAEQIEKNPNLTYTYFRDALRLGGDKQIVADWLEEVSYYGWSADEAARKLTERLGHKTHESAEGTINSYTIVSGIPAIVILVTEEDMKWLSVTDRVLIKAKS